MDFLVSLCIINLCLSGIAFLHRDVIWVVIGIISAKLLGAYMVYNYKGQKK